MSATRLYEAGYTRLIPVIPPRAQLSPKSRVKPEMKGKVPGLRRRDGWVGMHGWQDYHTEPDDPARWESWGANVGMVADHFPAVDIDVDDPELSRVALRLALEHLGPAPCRLSRGSRRLLVYRTDEPFPRTGLEIHCEGERHVVEVLGRGREYLVHGTHPSGAEYRWAKTALWDIDPEDLTPVTGEQVQSFLEALRGEMERMGIGSRIQGTPDHERGPVPPQEELAAPSLEALEDVVSRIENTGAAYPDRDSYIAFGCAVKAAGGDDALHIFQEWAGRWDEGVNDPAIVEADWERMRPPFRIGWEWLRRKAGDDAKDDFSVDPTATPPLPPAVALTEEDFVERIRPEVEDQLRYVPAEKGGAWMVWDGHRWVADNTLAAQRIIRGPLRRLARSLVRAAEDAETKEAGQALRAAAKKLQSDAGIRSITSLLRALVTCTPDQFDADPWQLNTPGLLLDLRAGRTLERTPGDLLSKATAVTPAASYDPAKAPLWSAFLEHLTDGDEDLAAFLQRYAGYCLTGDVSEKVFLFAWGSSDTGKSTFINALSMVMGDYAGHVAMESLLDAGRGRVPDDIAQLPGKRLVTASEPKAGAHWNDELIKAITGRDTLTVRRLWHGNFQLKPSFKLLIGGNHEPKLGRVDDAMRRRLLIAPMDNKVRPEDQVGDFESVLVQQEGPQILAWMVEGCRAWRREGLVPPEAVRATTDRYWEGEDGMAQWLEESCELDPEAEATRAELYDSWRAWCGARGVKAGPEPELKQYLDGRAEELDLRDQKVGPREARRWGYKGIRVLLDLEGI